MTKKFTGLHMLTVMILFFGTVIAVNVVMARYALTTFGGTVVDNSYVASQEYNGWLAKARAQKALGWKTEFVVDSDRRVEVISRDAKAPIVGASVSGVARHPLGRLPDVGLSFVSSGEGRYRTLQALPAGRWSVHLTIRRGGDEARLIETLG